MSSSSRNGFTWKEVADVLRVSPVSNRAISQREIERQKRGSIEAKRASVDTKGARSTSNQAQSRRPGASG